MTPARGDGAGGGRGGERDSAGDGGLVDSDDRPLSDRDWALRERDETPLERLDRNWNDLLQELRVVQTGVQLLTGFLLILPFEQRFVDLVAFQKNVYLTTLICAILATGFLIAPVMLHRILFRQHVRLTMVELAHRLAIAGTTFLALALVGSVLLIFNVVVGRGVGVLAAGFAALLLGGLWYVTPTVIRLRKRGEDSEIEDSEIEDSEIDEPGKTER